MPSGRLSWLASRNGSVALGCTVCLARTQGLGPCGVTYRAAEAVALWGDMTLEDLRRRARCRTCGRGGDTVTIECWTPLNSRAGF